MLSGNLSGVLSVRGIIRDIIRDKSVRIGWSFDPAYGAGASKLRTRVRVRGQKNTTDLHEIRTDDDRSQAYL